MAHRLGLPSLASHRLGGPVERDPASLRLGAPVGGLASQRLGGPVKGGLTSRSKREAEREERGGGSTGIPSPWREERRVVEEQEEEEVLLFLMFHLFLPKLLLHYCSFPSLLLLQLFP